MPAEPVLSMPDGVARETAAGLVVDMLGVADVLDVAGVLDMLEDVPAVSVVQAETAAAAPTAAARVKNFMEKTSLSCVSNL